MTLLRDLSDNEDAVWLLLPLLLDRERDEVPPDVRVPRVPDDRLDLSVLFDLPDLSGLSDLSDFDRPLGLE